MPTAIARSPRAADGARFKPGSGVAFVALLVCLVATGTPARAQDPAELAPITARVVDGADLLEPAREAELDALLAAHEAESTDQVVVVTVDSLNGLDIADYALRLARASGLGTAERDNGALLLVAPAERDVRIEVGRGLEGALTDARSGIIIRQEILPAFRDGDYAAGIERGVRAMLQTIDGEYEAPPSSSAGDTGLSGVDRWVPFVFLAMIAVPELLRRAGARRAANGAFPAGFAGLFGTLASGSLLVGVGVAVALFVVLYLAMRGGGGGGGARRARSRGPLVGGYVGGGTGGGMGGGMRGGGGFGGGGFSGGGGGFGGGGASGGW